MNIILLMAHWYWRTRLQQRQVLHDDYPLKGFHDFQYKPDSLAVYKYINDEMPKLVVINKNKLEFSTTMFNPVAKKNESILLVPMGKTILRQVSFKPF